MISFISLFKKTLIFLVCFILSLEVLYRFQGFDHFFYKFTKFNKGKELLPSEKTILIFGDSHSQVKNSYSFQLKKKLPNHKIINLSLAGSGLNQTKLFFKKYVDIYKPEYIIMQIYVGDDLFDLNYETKKNSTSLKNTYYKLINSGLNFLWHVNANIINQTMHSLNIKNILRSKFQLKKVAANKPINEIPSPTTKTIDIPHLIERIKLNPGFIDQQLNISTTRYKKIFSYFVTTLSDLVQYGQNNGAKTILLFIPHKTQIDQKYLDMYLSMGATYASSPLAKSDYPLLKKTKTLIKEKIKDDVIFINPVNDLVKMSNNQEIEVYRFDEHLSEKGYGLLSDLISQEIN